MIATAASEFLFNIFGIESVSEDFVKWIVYACLGSVFWRLIRLMNGWKGWRTSRKKEVIFWVVSLPMFFAIVSFASTLGPPRGGKFRAGVITVARVATPSVVGGTNELVRSGVTISGIGVPQKIDEKGVNFLVVAKVDNPGQPSTAWNWKVTAILDGGTRLPALIPSVTFPQPFTIDTIIGPYSCKMEDNLLQSLSVNPLPQGSSKIGWLMFHISGISELPIGSQIQISFENVFGRKTVIEHPWDPPN